MAIPVAPASDTALAIDAPVAVSDALSGPLGQMRAGRSSETAPLAAPSAGTLQDNEAPGWSTHAQSLAGAPFVAPIDGAHISSPFGMRLDPAQRQLRRHTGVDLAAPLGTPVKAAESGTVEFVGFDRHGYGSYVVVHHESGFSTWYAHLSKFAAHLRAGIRIRTGQLLGNVGRTGDATGPHLHFEVRLHGEPVDPLPLMHGRASSMAITAKSGR